MLTILEELPKGLLDIHATELYKYLKGPTLIHLPGRRENPLFVSLLLHGNEDTGFFATQRLLKKYQQEGLPRALSIFIGNVEAARYQKRRMEDQPDYNRIWRGSGTPEHEMMAQVLGEMEARKVFASLDVHNNTGINPHYACVNRLDHRFFQLALLFSRTVVYFIRPEGVQTNAFADLCPAVTVECGHVGEKSGIDHALEFLEAVLHLKEIPDHSVHPQDIGLFHTVATVKVPDGLPFGFGEENAQIRFMDNLDHLNFTELAPGTLIAWVSGQEPLTLDVIDEAGEAVGDRYFNYSGGEIRTKIPIMPSMFTLNKEIIRQDVLGYIMERMDLPAQS